MAFVPIAIDGNVASCYFLLKFVPDSLSFSKHTLPENVQQNRRNFTNELIGLTHCMRRNKALAAV